MIPSPFRTVAPNTFLRWAVVTVVTLAALLRLHSISFGLPSVNDQDELLFQLGAVRMLQGPTLNPHWFGHPATTTMYAVAITDAAVFLTGLAAGWWGSVREFLGAVYLDPTYVMLPARLVIAVFGVLSILLTIRLSEEIADRKVGLAAAMVLAITPLHIEFSQIIRSDMMATAFMLLSALAASRAGRGAGDLRSFAKAGLWAGVAVATKWPSALVLVCILGAAFMHWTNGNRSVGRLVGCCAVGVLSAAAALVLVSPFLVLDWHTVAMDLAGEARPMHLGSTGGSFFYNVDWYFRGPLLRTLGPIGLALAVGGVLMLARTQVGRFILLPLLAAHGFVLGLQALVWDRWVLPIVPILAISAAFAAVTLAEAISRQNRRWALAVGAAIAAAVLVPIAVQTQREAAERMNDTRQMASRLVLDEARPGQTVLIEHFAFDLLQSDLRILWPAAAAGCIDTRAMLDGRVSLKDVEALRGGNSNVDIGSVPVGLADSCSADYVILSHFDRYLAEQQRFPEQYRRYQRFLLAYEPVATFTPEFRGQNTRIVRVMRRKTQTTAQAALRPVM